MSLQTGTYDRIKNPYGLGEGFPMGNGRIGAFLYGGSNRERILLNEDSVWYGGPQDRINQDCKENLKKIRELIFAGNIREAEELMMLTMSGTPQSERCYQMAGDLWLNYEGGEETEYGRDLDLQRGIATETYCINGQNRITKEYLVSYPAQVMAIKLTGSLAGGISLRATLERGRFFDGVGALDEQSILFWANQGEGGVRYVIGVTACAENGSVDVIGENLRIRNADEAVLYVAIESGFYHPADAGHLEQVLKKRLDEAREKGYERIREEHIQDYTDCTGRMSIHLESDTEPEEVAYTENYFAFVRHLVLSAGRAGSLPMNLQGIWNDSMTPCWDSKYTININAEMNYWPVEEMNLPECHMPFFELLKRMHKTGHEVAERMYGCDGFVAHHNTDIWADCAPQDIYIPATYWVMGAAWMCTHIRKHYLYTQDRAFLQEYYPVLEDAVRFFHDFLTERDGRMLTCPSVSPENTYRNEKGEIGHVCYSATMDNQILRDLMDGFLAISEELGICNDFTDKTKQIRDALPPLQIGQYGQIMEWPEDYEEMEPGHRHISHLYGLFPGNEITCEDTPDMYAAAAETLRRRLQFGGGHTGWSCAWIVNLYARLRDGENAWANLKKLFENSTFPNRLSTHPMGPGQVFQIDGNMGGASGIIRMLVDSTEKRTVLLPAVPSAFSRGRVQGMALVYGGLLDMDFAAGRVTEAWVSARKDMTTTFVVNGETIEVQLKEGERRRIV